MHNIRFFLLSALWIALASPIHAQDINAYVSFAPEPDWVDPTDADLSPFEMAKGDPVEYLLYDLQALVDAQTGAGYTHQINRLTTPAAIEENANFTVVFDPEYQRVEIHKLRVWRGETFRDFNDLSEFHLFRSETDRDKLIYNGDMQLSFALPDIRVGDAIEQTFTVIGKNPAIGPNFTYWAQSQYAVPIKRLRTRLLSPQGAPVYSLSQGGDIAATKSVVAGMDVYERDLRDVAESITEPNLPIGQFPFPQTTYSSYKDWSEVGTYFAPIYAISNEDSQAVNDVVASIRAAYTTDEDRVIAALDFVQKEVRYLGIELGAGGYIPRAPQLVVDRRFGDCKDMTVLLIAILHGLNIQADPVLVSQQYQGAVATQQPTHAAFDHVITQVTLGTKTYFFDPTRGEQLGDLEHRQQGDFGKGVLIAADSPGMIAVVAPKPGFYKMVVDTFTPIAGSNDGTFQTVTDEYMAGADQMNNWLKSGGIADISRSYLQYYQNTFPGISEAEPLTVEVFEKDAHVRVTGHYQVPNMWQTDQTDTHIRTLWVRPYEINAAIPQFNGTDRKSDFGLAHPMRISHEINVVLDDSWQLDVENLTYDHPALHIEKRQRFINNRLSTVYTYTTKSDRIMAADFTETMTSIGDTLDYSGVYLTQDTSVMGKFSAFGFDKIYWIYVAALVIATFIGIYLSRNRDITWRQQQLFYPVAMPKFLVLTVASIGFYYIYWCYKNWYWVRETQGEDISPFWRALFSGFTNFSLFPRLAKSDKAGFAWFGAVAIPLAALMFFGNALGQYINKTPFVPIWLHALNYASILLYILPALQVLKLNKDNAEAVRLNSKFTLGNFAFIVGMMPMLVLIAFSFSNT